MIEWNDVESFKESGTDVRREANNGIRMPARPCTLHTPVPQWHLKMSTMDSERQNKAGPHLCVCVCDCECTSALNTSRPRHGISYIRWKCQRHKQQLCTLSYRMRLSSPLHTKCEHMYQLFYSLFSTWTKCMRFCLCSDTILQCGGMSSYETFIRLVMWLLLRECHCSGWQRILKIIWENYELIAEATTTHNLYNANATKGWKNESFSISTGLEWYHFDLFHHDFCVCTVCTVWLKLYMRFHRIPLLWLSIKDDCVA